MDALERKKRKEQEERERVQREREEQLARELREQQLRKEALEREALERQIAADMEYLREYHVALQAFMKQIPVRKQIRAEYEQSIIAARQQWEKERRQHRKEKTGQSAPT